MKFKLYEAHGMESRSFFLYPQGSRAGLSGITDCLLLKRIRGNEFERVDQATADNPRTSSPMPTKLLTTRMVVEVENPIIHYP